MTDGRGIPLGLVVAGANVNDHLLLEQTLQAMVVERPSPSRTGEQHLCLDKGYDYEVVDTLVDEQGFVAHLRRRGEDTKAKPRDPAKKARRPPRPFGLGPFGNGAAKGGWVVERAHSWLNRFRRILVRWEKRADTYTAMLQIACAVTAWENAGLPG